MSFNWHNVRTLGSLSGAVCYLSLHFPLRLGTEMGSLLPFLAIFSAFGHWDAFSVTFSRTFLCVRALRWTLCYLSLQISPRSGTEMRSLLPFHAIFSEFGHWEALSVTYSCFSHCVRALRRLLCYLSLQFSPRSGNEAPSLLPFPALSSVFGHWHALSVTFPSIFLWFLALRSTICYLSMQFWMRLGTETLYPKRKKGYIQT